METTKNIVLIDDHVIIRDGLKEIVGKLGYKVTGEFDNGRDLVDALPLSPTPDLLLMDLAMPQMNGDEVLEHMNEKGIQIPILILTLNQDENRMVRLFRNGIRGYLEKNCTAAVLREALDEIFKYGYYHNELLTYALRNIDGKKTERELILERISEREKRFLELVCHADEYTYEQIADMMNVVLRTVDGYRGSLFEKFNIKSKTGLVLFAIKHKLVDL